MSSRSQAALAATIVLLAAAALGAIAADPWLAAEGQTAAFQRLTGGLGLGPATDLSVCAFAFDPRISPACPAWSGPIAGGGWFCRCHPRVGWDFPPFAPADASRETSFDAPPP
jgi:hypothetical protein